MSTSSKIGERLALLSVSDKSGIVDFAARLADIGFIQLVPAREIAVRSKHKLSRFDSQNSLSSRPNPNNRSLKPMAR